MLRTCSYPACALVALAACLVTVAAEAGSSASDTALMYVGTGTKAVPQRPAGPPTKPEADLRDVASSGNRFVAVGNEGVLISSADGVHWRLDRQRRPLGISNPGAVTYGAGRFVALWEYYSVAISPDGEQWTFGKVPRGWKKIAWIGDRFVASGINSVATSTDGADWTVRLDPTPGWRAGIAYGNGRTVIVGRDNAVVISTDGTHWTSSVMFAGDDEDTRLLQRLPWSGIAWNGSRFAAVADGGPRGGVAVSMDGLQWRGSMFPIALRDVKWCGTRFVAVGANIAVSNDGEHWTLMDARDPVSGSANLQLSALTCDGRLLVAAGNGVIYISDDGFAWRGGKFGGWHEVHDTVAIADRVLPTRPSPTASRDFRRELDAIAYANLVTHPLLLATVLAVTYLVATAGTRSPPGVGFLVGWIGSFIVAAVAPMGLNALIAVAVVSWMFSCRVARPLAWVVATLAAMLAAYMIAVVGVAFTIGSGSGATMYMAYLTAALVIGIAQAVQMPRKAVNDSGPGAGALLWAVAWFAAGVGVILAFMLLNHIDPTGAGLYRRSLDADLLLERIACSNRVGLAVFIPIGVCTGIAAAWILRRRWPSDAGAGVDATDTS